MDHHIARGHYTKPAVAGLERAGIAFFGSAAIAARQHLPPIVVTARQEEVPYLPLTGASQELLSLQEERVAAEMRHQETMAQLKANAAAIALTPAQAAQRVDACMVRLLGHLPLCLSCVLCMWLSCVVVECMSVCACMLCTTTTTTITATTATTTTTTSRWLTTYPGCVWRIVRTQEKYNLVQNPSLPDNVVTKEAMIEMLLQQNEAIVARLVQAAGGGAAAAAAAGAAAPREEVPAPRAQPVWSSWRVDGHDVGVPPDMDVPNSDVVQAITCVMCSVMCRLCVCGGGA